MFDISFQKIKCQFALLDVTEKRTKNYNNEWKCKREEKHFYKLLANTDWWYRTKITISTIDHKIKVKEVYSNSLTFLYHIQTTLEVTRV